MKLTADFIDGLPLPSDAWTYEILDSSAYYTLRNTEHANVFWVDLWYKVLAEKFRSQNVVERIELLDLTRPVIVTDRLELVSAQPVVENIVYYSGVDTDKPPPRLYLNMTMWQVYVLSLFVFVTIAIAGLCSKTLRPYANFV